MVHDLSRALMWLFTFSLNLAQKTFQIQTRYNCIYSQKDILKALTFLSFEAKYANKGLRRLSKRLRRAKTPARLGKAPNGDTFLLRLKQINRKKAQLMLHELNRQVLQKAKQKGAFRKRVDAAIDLTFIPYYGKRFSQYVVGGEPKQGTSYFHCWATLRIVSAGRRFTIKAIPIKRSQLDSDEIAKIVLELLSEAKSLNIHIRFVMLDKGFYNKAVIRALQTSSYRFLVAAKRNKYEKEAILHYFRTGRGQVRAFGLGNGKQRVSFRLTIHRFRKRKRRRVRNILELYGAFATNLGLSEALRVWERLPEDYRRRWGVETGYRVDKEFMARTTSTDGKIRYIYFQYMVFLENVWTLYNMEEAKKRALCLDDLKRPLIAGEDFCEDCVYLLVNACDAGPPVCER